MGNIFFKKKESLCCKYCFNTKDTKKVTLKHCSNKEVIVCKKHLIFIKLAR